MKRGTIEKTLKNFGLSEKQAEVYIFLGKSGPLKGGEITKQLKMNKGQVYRILRKLQKKGLVEETLEFPARFTAVPLETVIDSFVKSKREEVAHIEEAKKRLLSDWKKISQSELDSSLEKFSVIEGKKKIFHKIEKLPYSSFIQLSEHYQIHTTIIGMEAFLLGNNFYNYWFWKNHKREKQKIGGTQYPKSYLPSDTFLCTVEFSVW